MTKDIAGIVMDLKSAGLKATPQRIAILHQLLKSHTHPSSEEVYDLIKNENPSISLGTVYKTLESFEQAGLIVKVATSDGVMRYDGKTGTHNHIFITNTNEIMDFEDDALLKQLELYLAAKKIKNLNIKNIRIHIEGEKIDLDKEINIK